MLDGSVKIAQTVRLKKTFTKNGSGLLSNATRRAMTNAWIIQAPTSLAHVSSPLVDIGQLSLPIIATTHSHESVESVVVSHI
eukprot:m.115308 g.115308  ORF g.115308 m.115308 type:complete len:82 (+) comp13087_c0_seq1:516-761(+)